MDSGLGADGSDAVRLRRAALIRATSSVGEKGLVLSRQVVFSVHSPASIGATGGLAPLPSSAGLVGLNLESGATIIGALHKRHNIWLKIGQCLTPRLHVPGTMEVD